MVMANCARKTLQVASASTRTLLSRPSSPPSASYAAKFNGLASSPKVSTQKRSLSFSWLPVHLASVQVSLTPLHSTTASALFTSLLSLHNNNWGCLSEGMPASVSVVITNKGNKMLQGTGMVILSGFICFALSGFATPL